MAGYHFHANKECRVQKKQFFLIIFSVFLYSCQEEKCSQEYESSVHQMESNFLSSYHQSAGETEKENLLISLNGFLDQFKNQKCELDGKEINPTSDVEAMRLELVNQKINRELLQSKVIYGEDDRKDLSEVTNKEWLSWAKSTMAQIAPSELDPQNNILSKILGEEYTLCSGEKFYNQFTAARCSGFLISDELVVTAGHCMLSESQCRDNYWVFDYQKGVSQLKQEHIYGCHSIVDQKLNDENGLDYAIIKLNRKVKDRKFFRFRQNGKVSTGSNLMVIGHPSGLPTKIAAGGKVRKNNEDHFFVTNVDSFQGNSGSPIIDVATGMVEGILVRGEQDYQVIDGPEGKRCRIPNVCSENGCDGEEATRLSSLKKLPIIYDVNELRDGMYGKKQFPFFEGSVFSYLGFEYGNWSIAGRRFLRACGAHIQIGPGPSWKGHASGMCDGNQAIDDLFKEFIDLVYL
jgi:hypothetical protein